MGEKLDKNESVIFEELLVANTIQVDALAQLLIEKGIITNDEFLKKVKQVQLDYQSIKINEPG